MAVTNKQIIATYKLTMGMDINAPLHTYARWKQLGYCVKKGEKSEHKIDVWKPVHYKKKDENGVEQEHKRLIMKTSAFFTREQVEEISG